MAVGLATSKGLEWMKKLTVLERQQYLIALKNQYPSMWKTYLGNQYGGLYALVNVINWGATPQGHSYWSTIAQRKTE